jgi:hypothetical protein
LPRKHHSPSSLATAELCERKWGYTYLAGLRKPEITWAQIEAGHPCSNGERSRALGTAVHSVLEAWYLGQEPEWHSFPGQVALAGTRYLPHPSKLQAPPRVEQWVNVRTTPKLVGKVDLRVLPIPEESDRLGLPRGWVTVDYKTSKDLAWCKSVADLEVDGQLNLYALDHIRAMSDERAVLRWLYFDTGRKRQAKPVDVVRTYTDANAKVHLMLEHAKHLDTLESVEACSPTPDACGAFGGCEFHQSRGGPCDAQRRPGKIIQARSPKEKENMALGKFGAGFRAQVQQQSSTPAPTAAPFAPPPAPVQPAPELPPPAPVVVPEPPPAAPARGPGRPRKNPTPAPLPAPEVEVEVQPPGVRMTITLTGSPEELAAVLEKLYA